MFLIKLTLILYCFSFRKAEEIQSKEQDDPKMQRRYYPFGLEEMQAVTWTDPIYNPFMANYPILAEITPINERFQQISDSFRGYISPTLISQVYYPYYSVMCEYPPKGSDINDPDNDIEIFRQNQLQPVQQKLNDLAEKMKVLTDLFVEQFSTKESKAQNESKSNSNKSPKPKTTTELPKSGTKTEEVPLRDYKVTINEENRPKTTKEKKEPSSNISNNNVQSNVFQCEGLTCPDETQTCKITEQAIEPSYVDIQKTILCLSNNNKVLLKKESKTRNPNPGSSLNSSRTFNKNEGGKMKDIDMDFSNMNIDTGNIGSNFENMENEFEKAMEQFNRQMAKAFGTN